MKATSSQLRGFFATKFNEYVLLHQHKLGGFVYRYPLIQYKIINNIPTVIGINEGMDVLVEIFNEYDTLHLGGESYRIIEKHVKSDTYEIGISDSLCTYTFLTPWIALNQENFSKYQDFTSRNEKNELLEKVLIGNILSFSKTLEYTVSGKLICEMSVKPKNVHLKRVSLMAFSGSFQVNYKLPEIIGLGKSVSRGYGVIMSGEIKRGL